MQTGVHTKLKRATADHRRIHLSCSEKIFVCASAYNGHVHVSDRNQVFITHAHLVPRQDASNHIFTMIRVIIDYRCPPYLAGRVFSAAQTLLQQSVHRACWTTSQCISTQLRLLHATA